MPENNDFIPFHRPIVDEDDIQAVTDALRSGWITTGPKCGQFAEEFAGYVGAEHALALNSCTAALHLALAALDVKPGDEIITTPYTFAATSEVILYMNAKPVFIDVLSDNANIDPDLIADAITDRTVGIMPVHIAGVPCRMDEIMAIAREHGLWVVEDAAHAIETEWQGVKTGTWGDVGAYSFYPTKNITTGEGGMFVAKSKELLEKARVLALHGLSKDAWKRYDKKGSWYYEIVEQGYKYNFTDIGAAMGLTQLRKIDRWWEIRRDHAVGYNAAFADHHALITPPDVPDHAKNAWHLYPLRLKLDRLSIDRSDFIEKLREAGVGTSVHFIPLHLQPLYAKRLGHTPGDFPRAEAYFDADISLPLYPGLTTEQREKIIESVVRIADANLK